ncbi:hypothetical protein [Saccharothrix texasensis]|uniref:Uncharacterized protein n=1 Tax=Saccharothrix texasensis TaxID=103734 RepID=A0A3N1HJC7_9PSEU|nr:hypothetical protein [Saccharothrix texasensis]ROP42586.1 hypothetical protein EDD40_8092 [Saccharothrix texasensis]
MDCEPIAEPPGPTLPVPTGWWPEPDTIGWVVRPAEPDGPDGVDEDGVDD